MTSAEGSRYNGKSGGEILSEYWTGYWECDGDWPGLGGSRQAKPGQANKTQG